MQLMMANKIGFNYPFRSPNSPPSGTPVGVASAPDQVNVAQEETTLSPPSTLDTAHEGICSVEQRDEHQPSGQADQESNQAGSSSEVTRSPGEEIPEVASELQLLSLAGQPTGVGAYPRHLAMTPADANLGQQYFMNHE